MQAAPVTSPVTFPYADTLDFDFVMQNEKTSVWWTLRHNRDLYCFTSTATVASLAVSNVFSAPAAINSVHEPGYRGIIASDPFSATLPHSSGDARVRDFAAAASGLLFSTEQTLLIDSVMQHTDCNNAIASDFTGYTRVIDRARFAGLQYAALGRVSHVSDDSSDPALEDEVFYFVDVYDARFAFYDVTLPLAEEKSVKHESRPFFPVQRVYIPRFIQDGARLTLQRVFCLGTSLVVLGMISNSPVMLLLQSNTEVCRMRQDHSWRPVFIPIRLPFHNIVLSIAQLSETDFLFGLLTHVVVPGTHVGIPCTIHERVQVNVPDTYFTLAATSTFLAPAGRAAFEAATTPPSLVAKPIRLAFKQFVSTHLQPHTLLSATRLAGLSEADVRSFALAITWLPVSSATDLEYAAAFFCQHIALKWFGAWPCSWAFKREASGMLVRVDARAATTENELGAVETLHLIFMRLSEAMPGSRAIFYAALQALQGLVPRAALARTRKPPTRVIGAPENTHGLYVYDLVRYGATQHLVDIGLETMAFNANAIDPSVMIGSDQRYVLALAYFLKLPTCFVQLRMPVGHARIEDIAIGFMNRNEPGSVIVHASASAAGTAPPLQPDLVQFALSRLRDIPPASLARARAIYIAIQFYLFSGGNDVFFPMTSVTLLHARRPAQCISPWMITLGDHATILPLYMVVASESLVAQISALAKNALALAPMSQRWAALRHTIASTTVLLPYSPMLPMNRLSCNRTWYQPYMMRSSDSDMLVFDKTKPEKAFEVSRLSVCTAVNEVLVPGGSAFFVALTAEHPDDYHTWPVPPRLPHNDQEDGVKLTASKDQTQTRVQFLYAPHRIGTDSSVVQGQFMRCVMRGMSRADTDPAGYQKELAAVDKKRSTNEVVSMCLHRYMFALTLELMNTVWTAILRAPEVLDRQRPDDVAQATKAWQRFQATMVHALLRMYVRLIDGGAFPTIQQVFYFCIISLF